MPQANKGNTPSQGSRAPRRIFDIEQFIKLLVAGDRVGCREFLREYIAAGNDSLQALETLVWPACAAIDQLSRKDQILPIHEHAAMMLLAQLVQRLECGLVKHPARCRQVIVTSGRSPSEELAAEIFAGLAEADGFDVVFLGGGVESDDLFAEVGRRLPGFVVSFAAAGADAPRLRRLIDAVAQAVFVNSLEIESTVSVGLSRSDDDDAPVVQNLVRSRRERAIGAFDHVLRSEADCLVLVDGSAECARHGDVGWQREHLG